MLDHLLAALQKHLIVHMLPQQAVAENSATALKEGGALLFLPVQNPSGFRPSELGTTNARKSDPDRDLADYCSHGRRLKG